ncbi:MAG: hypothetical protein K1X74_04580 [Pirellulales bacterium]|nr:hypothetical protein [Pirellulales bacterium]
MRFVSPVFWIFLLSVVIVLGLLPRSWRKWWLLVTSYLFYASWHWPYLALLCGCAVLTWWGGNWIAQVEGPLRARRGWTIILINVAVLVLYKYLDWTILQLRIVNRLLGLSFEIPYAELVLPLGISFYLFESSSYIFDVVKKRESPHGFWDVQLFIAFFPKLIAGPIMRAKELMPQFEGELRPTARDLQEGLTLIATGLFTKAVLADSIGPQVDDAFAREAVALGSTDVMVMSMAFAVQCYLDFSAYSRIALGAAQMCGIRLVENFNFPLSATSPPDFWNRWHMSLSRWIRDYVYYPLVGGRVTLGNMCRATILAMTICGVWHGAGWKFAVYGLYHGCLIAAYHVFRYVTRKYQPLAEDDTWAGRIVAGLSVVALNVALWPAWAMFRADDFRHALQLLAIMFMPWQHSVRSLSGTFYLHVATLMALVWMAPYLVPALKQLGAEIGAKVSQRRQGWLSATGGAVTGLLFALCLVYLRGKLTFIYFQF